MSGGCFPSWQPHIHLKTDQLSKDPIGEQTHLIFQNFNAIATEGNLTLGDAIKVTIFLSDINYFEIVNEVYAEYFSEPYPARSAFQIAALPLGTKIEIEAVFKLWYLASTTFFWTGAIFTSIAPFLCKPLFRGHWFSSDSICSA